jgi:hypothetical protein
MDLGDWRQKYLRAARVNDVSAMQRMIQNLYRHVRGHDFPSDLAQNPSAKTWERLCAEAQHEQDPGRLLTLVTEINRLLEEEQSKKRAAR